MATTIYPLGKCDTCGNENCINAGWYWRHARTVKGDDHKTALLRELTDILDEEIRHWDDAGYEFPNADALVPLLKQADALLA